MVIVTKLVEGRKHHTSGVHRRGRIHSVLEMRIDVKKKKKRCNIVIKKRVQYCLNCRSVLVLSHHSALNGDTALSSGVR